MSNPISPKPLDLKQQKKGLYRHILILYIICFGVYCYFTRKPDYFESDTVKATIQIAKDSITKQQIAVALYKVGDKSYTQKVDYVFRNFVASEPVTIIYDHTHPEKSALYHWWGYWVTWEELLGSFIIYFILFQASIAMNMNGNPITTDDDKPISKTKRRYGD